MAYYENINLEKGMFSVPGKTFTQVLEEMDSTKNYEGTELAGLDAFERQLKRFGIKVNGMGSDRVEKFFTSSSSAALFPEYVARAVAAGMEGNERAGGKLSDIVAAVTKVVSPDYRPIKVSGGELSETAEGGELPKSTIKTAENLITLKKRGRMLESSYEAIRFQRLDVFTVALRQIGAFIAAGQIKDAVDTLLNGDGNIAGAELTDVSGALTYGDFISLWSELAPYNLNVILAGTEALSDIMQIAEFKDSTAGQSFHGTGTLVTPLGAKLIHVPSMESGKILGIDKNSALEMVQAGDVITEADKLIDRQLERASISVISGFSRIFGDAAKGLSYGG